MESIWIEKQKELLENGEKLDKKRETDICIIGGGITGITCAFLLSKVR